MKNRSLISTRIEKLIFGGQALGRVDKKVILVWNALPDDIICSKRINRIINCQVVDVFFLIAPGCPNI